MKTTKDCSFTIKFRRGNVKKIVKRSFYQKIMYRKEHADIQFHSHAEEIPVRVQISKTTHTHEPLPSNLSYDTLPETPSRGEGSNSRNDPGV